jgi:DNA replication and repair protein RecF
MKIQSLKIENYRSWGKYSLDFNDVTILIGSNGVGKSNILESVWYLAAGRSWRTSRDLEIIQWGKDYLKTEAQVKNERDFSVELVLQNIGGKPLKQLKLNGVKHRLIDLLGEMTAVLFSPEEINMINGAPALRRRFLDIMLSQLNKNYALSLLEYNKVLKERNKLLENIKHKKSKPDELDFWDEKLAEYGCLILSIRKKAIKFFNQNLTEVYQQVSGDKETMKIIYRESAPEDNFLDHLVAVRERETEQGGTVSGPHRDDMSIYLNDMDLSTFGSRGEFRSAILSLKILELRYIEQEKGEKPILLLDDIFSELDSDRRMHLAKIVEGQQTIITTTDLDHIEKGLRERAKIIELKP